MALVRGYAMACHQFALVLAGVLSTFQCRHMIRTEVTCIPYSQSHIIFVKSEL